MPVEQNDLARPSARVVRALGRRVRVSATGAGAAEFSSEFESAWDLLIDDDVSPVDDEVFVVVPATAEATIAESMATVESQITLAAIRGNIGAGLLFHAAAMTDASGSAILLVGPSGAGKTTAVRHFGSHHGYVTDEIALVRADGLVVPYQKPLSLARPAAAKAQLAPRDLGLTPAPTRASAVDRVVVLDRRPDADERARMRRFSLTDSIFALVPHLSSFTATPRPLVLLARLIVRIGGVEQLAYRSIDTLDPRSAPTSPPLDAEELVFTTPLGSTPPAPPSSEVGRRLVRTVPHDAIETPDVLIVAREDTVTALAGVSRTLWHETSRPRSMTQVLLAVRTELGAFDGDDAITASHIDELVEHGILRWLP